MEMMSIFGLILWLASFKFCTDSQSDSASRFWFILMVIGILLMFVGIFYNLHVWWTK